MATFDRQFSRCIQMCSSVGKSDEKFQNPPRLRTAGFLLQLHLNIGFVEQMKSFIAHDSIQKTQL